MAQDLKPLQTTSMNLDRATAALVAVAHTVKPISESNQTILAKAEARGHFTPDEDEAIRSLYADYLSRRAAILSTLEWMEKECGGDPRCWENQLPHQAVAVAAAGLLIQMSSDIVIWAGQSRLLRKKLDEADPSRGIPRKTFAKVYRAVSNPIRLGKFLSGLEYYRKNRPRFSDCVSTELIELLDRLDERFAETETSDIWRDQFRYRWFSFRRRHHSAWKKTMFGIFEESGKRIADLRQPGVKPTGAPKRITPELRSRILELARPGDVFVTRHDDALSNLFLPGFWPHAALYFGSEKQRKAMGIKLPDEMAEQAADPVCFLEAKKDGVLFRPADDTLEVDCLVILRPPLNADELSEGLARAGSHADKHFDFVFDFRKSDRLVCTEVVYRGYDGCGPLNFDLLETGGRICLPAEELITQGIKQGFSVVATCGLGDSDILEGPAAEAALQASRRG